MDDDEKCVKKNSNKDRLSLFSRLTALQRGVISALAGFLFYGGWAYWVNCAHGTMVAIKVVCVQGSYSFLLTLSMTMLLEGLFRFNARFFNHPQLLNWSTILVCCAVIFSGSWAVNAAAGTPEIFKTVILGYVIGSIYSTSYVYSLARN